MNQLRYLSLFSAICLATPLLAQGEVDLRTTAKKGSSVWLVQETKQAQVIDMQGQEMETEQSTTRTLCFTVKDVDDKGNLVVETKIARIQGSTKLPMGMGDMEFDSAAPASDEDDDGGMGGMGGMMKKAMMAGAGKSFTAKLSPLGKVIELMDGAADILKSDDEKMPGGEAMSADTLKQLVESAFGTLPEKATAVGAKWQHTQKEGNARMPAESKLEMTLTKADAESFEITAVGTVDKPAEAKADTKDGEKIDDGDEQEAMGREMLKSMKMKNGKQTGTLKVSRQDGFVLESTNTVTMDVEMSAGQMGDMQMSMKQTVTCKRTTAEAAVPAKKAEAPKDEPKKDAGK